ncbi:PQQ-like beta-propeller repeat protein [Breoghania sp. L-A4]|uniref:PQQ-like beta-propeller repeat protein n=1 Tax=Breoghania sp. L-A4 TaxID=2304600 RepID=UPI000E35887D|nr:PQQ-like beta-propeller repeat protein [Breoghania sp. L-A4]AXS42590.1 hypothetical protein D1F64_12430 [Breoghania sp. L-A4]
MTRPFSAASVVIACAVLAGCSSVSDVASSLNPFSEREDILQGERQELFEGAGSLTGETGGTASVPGPSGAADWSQGGGNAANNPAHASYSGAGGKAWRVSVGTSSGGITSFGSSGPRIAASPISYQGRVFVYDPAGKVTALSQSNGGRQWVAQLRPEGEKGVASGGGVAADSGRIFAATGYGSVVALDAASGRQLWAKQLEAPARSAPTAVGGKVFVVTQTNEVYALNQEDGGDLWTYSGIPETAGLLSAANPAVSGDTVVVPFSSGEVMAIDAKSGSPRWIDAVNSSYRTQALSGLADVSASPVISDGVVFATSVVGRTIAVNLKNGDRLWEQDAGSVHTPVVAGNAVFLIDLRDRLIALDRKSGSPIWSTQLPIIHTKKKRSNWAGPVLAGGALWMLSSDGKMSRVDPATGTITWTRDVSEKVYISPIAAGGKLIAISGGGNVVAFN